MEDEKLIELLDERFAKVDQQFAKVDQQFAKVDQQFARVDQQFARVDQQFARVDQQFAKVDQQFAKVDQRFANVDEQFAKVHEEIRDSVMRTERLEEELGSTRMHIRALDAKIERLSDEVTLPSGRVSQQFMDAEKRDRQTRVLVEQLNGKIIANGEQMDLIQQKLDAFRVETHARLDALEDSRR